MSQLLLPLVSLTPCPQEAPAQGPAPDALDLDAPALDAAGRRTLDLDPGALLPWLEAVRVSSDACLVVDARSRLVALSLAAGVLLDLDGDQVGIPLRALVRVVDFSPAGWPEADQQRCLPPLQALEAGKVARALLRVRHRDDTLITLDVLSTPLASGAGSLTFLQVV